MQSFIRLFASFIPWTIFAWIMKTDIQLGNKIFIWLVLLTFMLWVNHRFLKVGDPIALSNIGTFIFIFINFFTFHIEFPMRHPATVCYGLMASSALLSILFEKPFTINYVGNDIPDEKKKHPVFIHINQVITFVWVSVFSVNATINFFFGYTVEVRVFSFFVIIIGIVASDYIPKIMRKYYRKQSTMPPAKGFRE